MFKPKAAFSGFSVDDADRAKAFYSETLGLKVEDTGMGLQLHLPDGGKVFVYAKEGHSPASFTILNFVVSNIDEAVAELAGQDVTFERYDGMNQDDKGIARGKEHNMGPNIAWFKDPAGN